MGEVLDALNTSQEDLKVYVSGQLSEVRERYRPKL